jgi:hypothetical protein
MNTLIRPGRRRSAPAVRVEQVEVGGLLRREREPVDDQESTAVKA